MKAGAHQKLTQYGESVASYRRAAQDFKSVGDGDDAGFALWFAARIAERNLKDQEQAITLYTEAVPLLLAANNHKEAAWASVTLGEIYVEVGKYADARDFLLNSMTLSERLHIPDVTFRARYSLAKAFDNDGEFERALPHYEAVIAQIRKGEYKDNDDEIYLYALKRARFICQVLTKYDLAIEFARAAALKYRERSDLESEVDTFAQLAELYVSLGDFETATDYLRQLLKIVRETRVGADDARLIEFEAIILTGIGETLSFDNKIAAAEIVQYFEDAKKLLTSNTGVDLLDEAQRATKSFETEGLKSSETLQKSLTSLDTNIRTIVRALSFSWGRISLKDGKLDTAIGMLSIALAIDSLSDRSASPVENAALKVQVGVASYYLADALRQKKDFASARRLLFAAEKVAAEMRSPLIHFA